MYRFSSPIDMNQLIFIHYINYIDWFPMIDFYRLVTPGYEPTPENEHNRQILFTSSVENVWSAVQRMCRAIFILVSRSTPRHHKLFCDAR